VDGRQRAAWRTAGRTEVGRAPVTSRPRRRMAGLCPGTASYARAPSTSLWSPRVGRDDGESCLQHSTSMAAFIGRSRECYRRWPVLVACTESACRVVCSAMLFCCGAVVVVPINYGANQRSTGIACTVLVVSHPAVLVTGISCASLGALCHAAHLTSQLPCMAPR
jgi:hypothetical protein